MSNYRKAVVAASGVLALLASAAADGFFASQEKEAIAVAVVSALFVFLVPNKSA